MIIKYNPELKDLARQLRNNATQAEIKLWKTLRRDQMYGYSHQILQVWKKDVQKAKRFNELDIRVLRFSDGQIMNDFENVYRAIEDYILRFEKYGLPPIKEFA